MAIGSYACYQIGRHMTREPIGELLDARGVQADMDSDDLVSDVVVIMKVTDGDGITGIILETSEGLDWITQLGMVDAAKTIIGAGTRYEDDEED